MASENKSKSSNGGNIDKKRKHRFLPQNKPVKKGSYPLRPGVEGFFITCDVGRERQASHEALNVIDSFYEELVLGRASGVRHGQLPDKPLNKKTKFTYSDSSSSDDDDDSNGDYANDDQKNKEEDKDKPGTHKDGDANNESSIDANSDPHKQEEDKVENKEHATCHGSQVVEGEEPPAKKQCLKTDASKCGNFISNKMEEKSVDKLIEEELAELGDRSKFQQCWIFFLFFIFFYLETYARDRSLFPIQKKYMRRFSNLDSGCNGVVFVQMRKRDGDPGTKDIVQHMMTSVALTRKHTSRFMLRVLPVEVTCYASEEEITKAIKPLISQYFPVETQTAHKFAVLYEARANTGIDRMKIINAVAKSVPAPHKVDLNNPDKNIVVQIVKTVCLMGVVEKYKELSKYNLRQLTSSKP